MNDGPPPGMFPDDLPADDRPVSVGKPVEQRRSYGPAFDFKSELAAFYKMLDAGTKERAELERLLPSNVDVEMFVRVAKTAVQRVPDLLNPEWRRSLLIALAKAAGQGLLPDGKHGALIVRWDESARAKQVCWQPMVWGIIKLGRLTGAIKTINAQLVFDGEEFEIEGGDELTFKHKVNPSAHDLAYEALGPKGSINSNAFFAHVAAAYCVITAADGSVIRRWMPRSRILRVREASMANKGPWNGPFCDEMALKTVILFASKWIETDIDTVEMRRFRAALEQDMEAEPDADDGCHQIDVEPTKPALPAPDQAMQELTERILAKQPEKVPAATSETPIATAAPGASRAQVFYDIMFDKLAKCSTDQEKLDVVAKNKIGVSRLHNEAPDLHEKLLKLVPQPASHRETPGHQQAATPLKTAHAFIGRVKAALSTFKTEAALNAYLSEAEIRTETARLAAQFPDLFGELTGAFEAKRGELKAAQ